MVDSEIVSTAELCKKYKLEKEEVGDYASSYYLVRVAISNTNAEVSTKTGIAIINLSLVGPNYYMIPSTEVFELMNENLPGASFSLYPGDTMEMVIPYEILGEEETKTMKMHKPKLLLTDYPTRKLIALE